MKKKDLVAAISEKSGLAKNQSEVALNAVIQWISVKAEKLNASNSDHNFLWPGLKTMKISVDQKD